MVTQILFQIPKMYATGVGSGELLQIGGLLKDAGTGKIVAHLQESGLAHQLVGKAMLGATSPATLVGSEALNMASGVYSNVQLTKLKHMIDALQSLQILTLGVALVGIGVTAAGFVYTHQRLNSIDKRLDALIETVIVGFEKQHKADIRAHMSRTVGLIQQAKQAFSLSKPDREYSRISENLADEAAYFNGELEFISRSQGNMNIELFWQLAQALMTCNSVRIDCRIRTNELLNAQTIAETVALEYQRLFDSITPVSFDSTEHEGELVANNLRDITDAAIAKPYLLDFLRVRRIDGREYMHRIEQEEDRPLLMLKAD